VLRKFPNLFPDDSPILVQRSLLIWKQEKWLEVTYTGEERTASGVYNFVTLESRCFIRKASARFVCRAICHIDLTMERELDYNDARKILN